MGLTVAASLLGATELTLRVAYGPPSPPVLLVAEGFASGRPFTVSRGMVTVEYQKGDAIDPFPLQPTPGVPRVLVFGGSSVHGGSHLDYREEFPGLVETLLGAQDRPIEVLNLAQPGRDSNSTRPVLAEALAFQPALVVFYMGHNDLGNTIMQARYPGVRGALEARITVLMQRSKIHEMLAAGLHSELLTAQQMAEPWAMPPLTEAQRVMAAGLFERNLVWMTEQIHAVGGEAILVTPISDMTLKPRVGATEADQAALKNPHRYDLATLDAALQAEPDRPDLLWIRGSQRMDARDPRGCDDLRRASDLDPRPLHASEAMADALRAAAAESGARLVDLRAEVLQKHCIPPKEWFLDEVHLSREGHEQVAAILAPAVAEVLAGR
jgi:lysophospholipase L1-like esterase